MAAQLKDRIASPPPAAAEVILDLPLGEDGVLDTCDFGARAARIAAR